MNAGMDVLFLPNDGENVSARWTRAKTKQSCDHLRRRRGRRRRPHPRARPEAHPLPRLSEVRSCSAASSSAFPVPSLLEAAARVTAASVPFDAVEAAVDGPIPEPVQRRILYHAFPRDEAAVKLYSTPAPSAASTSASPFAQGQALLDAGQVSDVLQIGFHLSGVVREEDGDAEDADDAPKSFNVSLTFDRCKVSTVRCSCASRSLWWCAHAVALALQRIRRPDASPLRLPLSDTLSGLGRTKLQKLLQWTLARHPEALATAQTLADQLQEETSDIAKAQGAPDPTAGGGSGAWYLDEGRVGAVVRSALASPATLHRLQDLFAKTSEMLSSRDDNGPRLLTLLTAQLLATPFTPAFPPPNSASLLGSADPSAALWEELASLWVTVVLNPFCRLETKASWHALLKAWASSRACPPEASTALPHHSVLGGPSGGPPRSILHRALDACRVQWNDPHLRTILSRAPLPSEPSGKSLYTEQGFPLWAEYVPTACARVESLRAHGYQREALSLAVAVVRHIRQASPSRREVWEGWLGHALDPVNALVDSLFAVSESKSEEGALTHRKVKDRRRAAGFEAASEASTEEETYLSLGVEVALVALAQSRLHSCPLARSRAARQEEALIEKLQRLPEGDQTIRRLLKLRSERILAGEVWWGGGDASSSAQSLCLFLFQSLVACEAETAYQVGLAALKAPLRLEEESEASFLLAGSPLGWPYPAKESGHSRLAVAMILASKEDKARLSSVVETVRWHIRSSSVVVRLAHDVQREADSLPDSSSARQNLAETALDLGLQVLSMTRGQGGWPRRSMLTWLINCVSHLSLSAVKLILEHWDHYFTPGEAVGSFGAAVLGTELVCQLKLSSAERESLTCAVQEMALACVSKAPSACALQALSLCESSAGHSERAYRIVVEAAKANAIQPADLFKIARLMEARGRREVALELGSLGVRATLVPASEDASPLVQELLWATALAYNSSASHAYHFDALVAQICRNVKSASVLSEILRRLLPWPLPSRSAKKSPSQPPQLPLQAKLLLEKGALRPILDAAMAAFVHTIHARLSHISPRHYGEFLDFLAKARQTFLLAADGAFHFQHLLDNVRNAYKGKKKLLSLVHERFHKAAQAAQSTQPPEPLHLRAGGHGHVGRHWFPQPAYPTLPHPHRL